MDKYDNSLERRINALICNIDENPVVNSVVPEESSYLGVKLRSSEEGFQQSVKEIYMEFTNYLDEYYQENTGNFNGIAVVDSTFSRLLSKYQKSVTDIKESPKRIEWRHQSKHFMLNNPNSDFEIEKTIKYIREANTFFFNMSGVQLLFLERLIEYLTPQLESIKNRIAFHHKEGFNPKTKQNHNKNTSQVSVYYFTVKEEFHYKYDMHLNNLYYGLKEEFHYINCTPVQFKMLFSPAGKKRMNTPEPIIWLSGAYSHLAYFIKYLVEIKFIKRTNFPSVNQIAQELFYDNEEEKKFIVSRIKSDIRDDNIAPYIDIKNMVNEKLSLKTRP
jgi:hypothetical protein